MSAIILRKCVCGLYKRYGGWIKPDEMQLKFISQAINSKKVEVEKEVCEFCRKRGV